MKYKKFLSFFLILVSIFVLNACAENSAEQLWERYVEAINNHDTVLVGEMFYDVLDKNEEGLEKFSQDQIAYLEDHLSKVQSIKTNDFETEIECDFSTSVSKQIYYLVVIDAEINGENQKIELYINHEDKRLYFSTPLLLENGKIKNSPNRNWIDRAYYTYEENGENIFQYEYVYETTDGVSSIAGVKIIRDVCNNRSIVLPDSIDGNNVTEIGSYAFYNYNKILSFTTATSKTRELVLPSNLKTIGEYSFFQCDCLKEVVIPESVEAINKMAFTGCTDLEKITFLRKTTNVEYEEISSTSTGGGDKPIVIHGAHNLQLGDIITLTTNKYTGDDVPRTYKWSTKNSNVSVNADTGMVTTLGTGDAIIKVELKDDPQVYAEVRISISSVEEYMTIDYDALNRCNQLKELVINAVNPNSIVLKNGKLLNLGKNVIIYVPKGSKLMYANSESWSVYASQIQEME